MGPAALSVGLYPMETGRQRNSWQPIEWSLIVLIYPNSFAFTLLLGLLAALPTFGIDMILPTLAATGPILAPRRRRLAW